MNFTYDSYCSLLSLIDECGYEIGDYTNWEGKNKCVILRHDIDNDISKAVQLAYVEKDAGVASTYFVLVTSDLYNIFSKDSRQKMQDIIKCGHQIGLHFDETAYELLPEDADGLCEKICYESKLLEKALDLPVKVVSMHRPSKDIIWGGAKLNLQGLINAYGTPFLMNLNICRIPEEPGGNQLRRLLLQSNMTGCKF